MNYYSLHRQDSGSGNFPPPPSTSGFTPPPPPPPPSGQTGSASTNAILALVLGILSFIMCPIILAIAAWIMGKNELKAIDNKQSPEEGRTFAKIGMWLGIINIILSIIGMLIFGLLLALGMLGSLFNQ